MRSGSLVARAAEQLGDGASADEVLAAERAFERLAAELAGEAQQRRSTRSAPRSGDVTRLDVEIALGKLCPGFWPFCHGRRGRHQAVRLRARRDEAGCDIVDGRGDNHDRPAEGHRAGGPRRRARAVRFVGWGLFAVSIVAGIATLLNLTGRVERPAPWRAGIGAPGIRMFSIVQLTTFSLAMIATVYFGARAL